MNQRSTDGLERAIGLSGNRVESSIIPINKEAWH
jgi:hypothetical protein